MLWQQATAILDGVSGERSAEPARDPRWSCAGPTAQQSLHLRGACHGHDYRQRYRKALPLHSRRHTRGGGPARCAGLTRQARHPSIVVLLILFASPSASDESYQHSENSPEETAIAAIIYAQWSKPNRWHPRQRSARGGEPTSVCYLSDGARARRKRPFR